MLRKTATGWEFEHEALLEDFLQKHLEPLLGLRPLAQQHTLDGQICDLIAISETRQVAILELKNQEDRYIVQQLTRYYDALIKEQPFSEAADYQQPVRLLAIAPHFHRNNFTDRKYSQLNIEFLTFRLSSSGVYNALQLKHLNQPYHKAVRMPEHLFPTDQSLPSPHKSLLSMLLKCPSTDKEEVY